MSERSERTKSNASDLVRLEHHDLEHGRAALLTLDRPDQLNPFDWPMITAVRERLAEIDADPTVRAVLLTGAGRAFSAGGDLKKYQELQLDPVEFPRFVADFHAMVRSFRGCGCRSSPW